MALKCWGSSIRHDTALSMPYAHVQGVFGAQALEKLKFLTCMQCTLKKLQWHCASIVQQSARHSMSKHQFLDKVLVGKGWEHTKCTMGEMLEYSKNLWSGEIQVSVMVQRKFRASTSFRRRQLLSTSYSRTRRSCWNPAASDVSLSKVQQRCCFAVTLMCHIANQLVLTAHCLWYIMVIHMRLQPWWGNVMSKACLPDTLGLMHDKVCICHQLWDPMSSDTVASRHQPWLCAKNQQSYGCLKWHSDCCFQCGIAGHKKCFWQKRNIYNSLVQTLQYSPTNTLPSLLKLPIYTLLCMRSTILVGRLGR